MSSVGRHLLTLAGLVAFTLWLPIAVVAWVPGWHQASCDWHDRCARYDAGRAEGNRSADRIVELRHYLQHRTDALPATWWTQKERLHLAEVRTLLERATVLALLGLLVFLHAAREERARAARQAMLGIAACVIVLPFFGTFWRDVFHPLLFDNNLWLNTRHDTSWWIMPRLYFQYTTALVVGSAALLCFLLRPRERR